MIETFMTAMALIGCVTSLVVTMFAITIAVSFIDGLIDKKRWQYKVKHRFDKTPIAKCYCVDCQSYDNESQKCYQHDWYVADDWFCWNANPRRAEE